MKELLGTLFIILLVFLAITFSIHLILFGRSFVVMIGYVAFMVISSVIGVFGFNTEDVINES